MDLIITAFATLGLLALLVAGLHRHQLSAAQFNADKNLPLPPLGRSTVKKAQTRTVLRQPTEAVTVLRELPATRPADVIDAVNFDKPLDKSLEEPPGKRVDETTDQASTENHGGTWLEKVQELKKAGQLEEALSAARAAFPLLSAFQQAILLQRARVKEIQKQGGDYTESLTDLYRTATLASLLHDRVRGLPDATLAQLKFLDLGPLYNAPMPYDQVGYLNLRLIKKTDIKLLVDAWGKPSDHQPPRQYCADLWCDLVTIPAQI